MPVAEPPVQSAAVPPRPRIASNLFHLKREAGGGEGGPRWRRRRTHRCAFFSGKGGHPGRLGPEGGRAQRLAIAEAREGERLGQGACECAPGCTRGGAGGGLPPPRAPYAGPEPAAAATPLERERRPLRPGGPSSDTPPATHVQDARRRRKGAPRTRSQLLPPQLGLCRKRKLEHTSLPAAAREPCGPAQSDAYAAPREEAPWRSPGLPSRNVGASVRSPFGSLGSGVPGGGEPGGSGGGGAAGSGAVRGGGKA